MAELPQIFRKRLILSVKGHDYWESCLELLMNGERPYGLHLAVFVEPYLQYILEGKKTVESRFSQKRISPYGKVNEHDIILLKKSGGPIWGLCQISNIWYYHLHPKSWKEIRSEFSEMLCAQDPEFWTQRKAAEFATLMGLKNVIKIQPINFPKNDRRGWVVLKSGVPQLWKQK